MRCGLGPHHSAAPAGIPSTNAYTGFWTRTGLTASQGNALQVILFEDGRPGSNSRHLLSSADGGIFWTIDSERGIALRVADTLALRWFLGFELHENTPDQRQGIMETTASILGPTRE
jgi:hypothetical protein